MTTSNHKLTADEARAALANRNRTLQNIYKAECEESLYKYVCHAWPHLVHNEMKRGWALRAICDHLQAVTEGKIQYLLINVPPGFSKSLVTNVFWPSWEWGPQNMPHTQYLNLSYKANLALRDNGKCLDLIQSDWYQRNWGDRFQLRADKKGVVVFANDKRGERFGTSVTGELTGRRADRISLDDPHNVKDGESDAVREKTVEIFASALQSRTNSEESAFVVIMQRVHELDVSGHIIANDMGYTHLCLGMHFDSRYRCYTTVKPSWNDAPPEQRVLIKLEDEPWAKYVTLEEAKELQAEGDIDSDMELVAEVVYPQDMREFDGDLLFPELFSAKRTARLVHSMMSVGGEYHVSGQLEQTPTPREGGQFKRSDFVVMTPRDIDKSFELKKIVRGWDLAASENKKADWTVGLKMARAATGEFIILDVVRKQLSPGGVESLMKSVAERDGRRVRTSIPQDPGQAGLSQKRTMASLLAGHDVRFSLESGDKVVRANSWSAQVEAGNVIVKKAPWNRTFFAEVCGFPNAAKDDQVDAGSRAFNELNKIRSTMSVPVAPRVIQLADYS